MKKIFGLILVLPIALLVCGCDGQKEQNRNIQGQNTEQEVVSRESHTQILEDNQREVDTENWQVYKNEEYGFEFQYPEDWLVDTDDSSVYIRSKFMRSNMPEGGGVIIISIENLDLQEFIENYEASDEPHSKIVSQEEYILDNFSATILKAKTAIGIDRDIIFISDKNNYAISFHRFDKYHQKIISTFKFINKSKNKTQ